MTLKLKDPQATVYIQDNHIVFDFKQKPTWADLARLLCNCELEEEIQ